QLTSLNPYEGKNKRKQLGILHNQINDVFLTFNKKENHWQYTTPRVWIGTEVENGG
ncbi:hypothetical protein L9F63_012884, partial [Diploptera punctata]